MERNVMKLLIAAPLVYAAYVTVKCPCDVVLSCHLPHFFLSVGISVGLTVLINSPK